MLEVLISMFVLLIGLMGVAALIPAGRFQIQQGAKTDHASMVGRAAFRALKIRVYLNPTNWGNTVGSMYTTAGGFTGMNMTNSANALTPAVAIDPLGLAAPTPFGTTFPVGAGTLSLTRIYPHPQVVTSPIGNPYLADPVFRSGDDLVFVANPGRDLPPLQQPIPAPAVGPMLKRASEGSYSWLATMVTDPASSALSSKLIVSVAVFFKRDLSNSIPTETSFPGVTFPGLGISGGEVSVPGVTLAKPIKPGQWVMLAGTITASGNILKYFRWYRVVAADAVNTTVSPAMQSVTLAGPDWNINTSSSTGTANAADLWLFDNVVAVYEKNMRLELP